MSKSPEQFDFSKSEDQEKFGKLSNKKREKLIEEAKEEATKINGELSEKESKEKEGKPFLFVYRENDLFKKYVPFIQNFLKEQGYPVSLQSFPAGTPEEEIKNWYLAHQTEIQAKDILADDTSSRSCGYDEDYDENLKSKINLDSLMNQSTTEAVMGDIDFAEHLLALNCEVKKNPQKKREYLLAEGEMYKKILTSIPEERRQKMEVVILKGLFRGRGKYPISTPLIEHEPGCPNRNAENCDFENLSKETNEFANKMEKWLRSSGISNITTFSTGAEIPPEIIKKLATGEAYIIFDRHTSIKYRDEDYQKRSFNQKEIEDSIENVKAFWGNNLNDAEQIRKQSALELPIEDFLSNVREKVGINNTDSQKVEESIKRILQEKLAEIKE